MANTETDHWSGLDCRSLTQDHVSQAHALSLEANWNQTARDWSYMISHGHGWGLFDSADGLVATALALPQQQGKFGWVSMVLVTKDWQRRGLAGKLLAKSVSTLLDMDLTPGLDATEFGRPVYLPLGFNDVYSLTRMECMSPDAATQKAEGVKAVKAEDLMAISIYDQSASGCDRSDLLSHLHERAPHLAWMSKDETGHCFGRDGNNAHQIGPIIAEHSDAAIELATTALQQLDGPIFIDAPDHQRLFVKWLASIGFTPQRSFTRMLHERTQSFDNPTKIFAIAGPELG